MANKKKEVFRPGPMTEEKRNIIQGLLQEYDIQSAADIQEIIDCCFAILGALRDGPAAETIDIMESQHAFVVHIRTPL